MLRYFDKNFLSIERSYDDAKGCIDTLAIISALLLSIPVVAASVYKNSDWDNFKSITEACGYDDNDLWGYTQVLKRMKQTTVASSTCILMTLMSVAAFHIVSTDETFKKQGKSVNLFILYLVLLVAASVILSVWVFAFFTDLFMMDSTDYCKKRAFFGPSAIVWIVMLSFSFILPFIMLTDNIMKRTFIKCFCQSRDELVHDKNCSKLYDDSNNNDGNDVSNNNDGL